jgi:hypothetical protein
VTKIMILSKTLGDHLDLIVGVVVVAALLNIVARLIRYSESAFTTQGLTIIVLTLFPAILILLFVREGRIGKTETKPAADRFDNVMGSFPSYLDEGLVGIKC